MLWHLPFAKLNDGCTPFTNSVTIFNVLVRHLNTSFRCCFANNVPKIIVTDWWWDARDLEHSVLEYWAFAQHCFSIVWSLSDNRVFTFFVTLRSNLMCSNTYLILCISATKSLFTESILLRKFTNSVTKSGLLRAFSDSSVSATIAG